MPSRSFVEEHDDERRKQLHGDTVLRAVGGGGAAAESSRSASSPATGAAASADPQSSVDVRVPEHVSLGQRLNSSMAWFKEKATGNKKAVLRVGIVVGVVVVLFVVLTAVAKESGQAAPARSSRLVVFSLDGVSVEEFRRAAALRRVPSMDFFASQSANCRPLSQEDYFRPIDAAATATAGRSSNPNSIFSTRFSECIMTGSASRADTIFSLLTGTTYVPPAPLATTEPPAWGAAAPTAAGTPASTDVPLLDALSKGGIGNFTSFLSIARERGLTAAILGAAPLLTVPGDPADLAKVESGNKVPPRCGLLDFECIAHTPGGQSPPECVVPADARAPLSQMITASSNCNSAFQGLISDDDTPDQVWARLKYVVESEADIIYAQIPEDTIRYWTSIRPQVYDAAPSAAAYSVEVDEKRSHFALDAALYDVDGIFSKLLRTVALQSMHQGEQWLVFLVVSSASERQILLASNVVNSGARQDAGNVFEVASMTPLTLHAVIAEWLRRK